MPAARPARARRPAKKAPAKKAAAPAKAAEPAPAKTRKCEQCTREFPAARSTAKYCSATCRSRARRRLPAGEAEALVGVLAHVVAELDRLGKFHTIDGQQALEVARRMQSPLETGAAVTSLSKELSRLMAVCNAKGGAEEDPLDEIARKRAEKEARARKASR